MTRPLFNICGLFYLDNLTYTLYPNISNNKLLCIYNNHTKGFYMKSAVVNARMETELKSEVETIFRQLGMNTTQAITMFFEQVRLHRAVPFQIKLPNDETVEAMKDALAGKNMETISMDDLISQAKSRVQ